MKHILLFLMMLFTIRVYSQETLLAIKENIAFVHIGIVKYSINEEGFFSPNGPFVDGNAVLYFYPTYSRTELVQYKNGVFHTTRQTNNKGDLEKLISTEYSFTSQEGTIVVPGNGLTFNYYNNVFRRDAVTWSDDKVRSTDYVVTPINGGVLLQSLSKHVILSAEFMPNGTITYRNKDETHDWLPTQPGGFTIGDDELLYRNGILWSVVNQPKYGTLQYEYIGRLSSGHRIWKGGGMFGSPGEFVITDPAGNVEIALKLPWSDEIEKEQYQYNYGLGPWGEIYFLLPPKFVAGKKQGRNPEGGAFPVYEPDPNGTAELVVVRNHLKYFGRLNDGGVRLRKDPSTSGEILGTYPEKTGFRILETGAMQETIGGQKNVWYKVRLLDGTEGWFFGAFVHNLYDGPNGNPPPWPNIPDW